MDFTIQTLVIIPIALGLLGFIEPCTIGGHLLFLDTQNGRSTKQKSKALAVFLLTRSLMAGLFGILIALFGQKLISVQTNIWMFFGLFYVAIGILFLSKKTSWVKQQINFAPTKWKTAKNPFILGIAFGFNIPACAAPILFGLLGLVATTNSVLAGFSMMFLFGLVLSLPLLPFLLIPKLAGYLVKLSQKLKQMPWIIGTVFVALGLWSIWFGLYVNPKDWSGL